MLNHLHPVVLSFGEDAHLLNTRGWVVARAGVDVVNVSSAYDFSEAVAGRFDLLLLCHTLSLDIRLAALASAQQHMPSAKRLLLAGDVSSCAPFAESLANPRPAALIDAVQSLLNLNFLPRHFQEIGMSTYEGHVKWFNNAKGYGFVGRNDGGNDVFTHFSSIQSDGYKSLKEGDPVTFEIIQGEKGPQADQVRLKK